MVRQQASKTTIFQRYSAREVIPEVGERGRELLVDIAGYVGSCDVHNSYYVRTSGQDFVESEIQTRCLHGYIQL